MGIDKYMKNIVVCHLLAGSKKKPWFDLRIKEVCSLVDAFALQTPTSSFECCLFL